MTTKSRFDEWWNTFDGSLDYDKKRLSELAFERGELYYKKLLIKYMTYLGILEGTDFITGGFNIFLKNIKFTEEDWDELNKISKYIIGFKTGEPTYANTE